LYTINTPHEIALEFYNLEKAEGNCAEITNCNKLQYDMAEIGACARKPTSQLYLLHVIRNMIPLRVGAQKMSPLKS